MRIAHVSHEYVPAISGVRQVVQELAERQVKAGHEVHIFTSDWDKSRRITRKEEKINGVHIHRFKHFLRVGKFGTFWPSFFSRLKEGGYDIVHSHVFGHPHFILASLAASLSAAKHIHTTHCPWSDAKRSLPARIGIMISYNIFSRLALKFTDKIIAITPWEFNYIKKFGGRDSQIVNIPNGMAAEFLKKVKNNDFKIKNRIRNKIVLFFGRLNATKGPDKFVEIAKEVLKRRKNTTFIIRGPDEGMRDTIKKLIGKEKRIILMPETRNKEEIIKMYQSSDIFLIPSYREGLPLTLFEAMACGLPIIATPVNGIPYEIKEPQNGFLVDYGNNEKFAQRIIELLDNLKLSKKISSNNLKRSKEYSWDLISKRTLELYNSVLPS